MSTVFTVLPDDLPILIRLITKPSAPGDPVIPVVRRSGGALYDSVSTLTVLEDDMANRIREILSDPNWRIRVPK
jgi:hypothetical protein